MTDNIKLPPMPKPHTPPVFATAANTQSVKAGYELGGYEKTPPLFDEHQLEAYAREAVRLNAQEAPFKEALAAGDFYPQVHGYGSEVQTQVATGTQEAPAQPLTVPDAQEKDLLRAIQERDAADDYIDALLDEVLGTDRPEWSSVYGHAEAMEQVRERISHLMKPSVDKAWDRFQSVAAPAAPQPALDWTPTTENINALPEPVRRYIAELETNCDPAGTVRDLRIQRDITLALEASNRMLRDAALQPSQQPLTDEQTASLAKQLGWDTMPERFPLIVRAIEQAHGIGVKP